MIPPTSEPPPRPLDTTAPRLARPLGRLLSGLDRLFDWAYHSNANPLYRSGTLVVGLLLVTLVTGIYLLFFYRVSDPYTSMVQIQDQWYLGRWIRALHRYASDAAVVVTLFHAFRMAVEGKAWGPRALAWISGVVLLAVLLITGWTGYVMVWDLHGLELARVGARMIDSLGILPEPLSRTFSGALGVNSAFFFMNLFLHVALPLCMIFVLWIHTAKLTHSKWLLNPRLQWTLVGALVLLSLVWPAPLAQAPDALATSAAYPTDAFYTAWFPYLSRLPVWLQWLFWVALAIASVSMPWWWKGKNEKKPLPAYNDISRCGGCQQCVEDCPFDAIDMITRPEGVGKAEDPSKPDLVALVNNDKCTGCSLCVAACSHLSIHPSDADPRDLLAQVAKIDKDPEALALVCCRYNDLHRALKQDMEGLSGRRVEVLELDCLGSLHHSVLDSLLRKFRGVYSVGCPPVMCRSRRGSVLYEQRVFQQRHPAEDRRLGDQVGLVELKLAERADAAAAFARWMSGQGMQIRGKVPKGTSRWTRRFRGLLLSLALLAGLAAASALPFSPDPQKPVLRLTWRVPGQKVDRCRDLSAEELASRPLHMRRKQECVTHYLDYELEVMVDGKTVLKETVKPAGVRADRPLAVAKELAMPKGLHQVRLKFQPLAGQGQTKKHVSLAGSFEADFVDGRAVLVFQDEAGNLGHHTEAVLTSAQTKN